MCNSLYFENIFFFKFLSFVIENVFLNDSNDLRNSTEEKEFHIMAMYDQK